METALLLTTEECLAAVVGPGETVLLCRCLCITASGEAGRPTFSGEGWVTRDPGRKQVAGAEWAVSTDLCRCVEKILRGVDGLRSLRCSVVENPSQVCLEDITRRV